MSAFMVSDETINDPIAFLKSFTNQDSWILSSLLELGYIFGNEISREKLAKDLFQLNIEAIEQRYGKGQAKEFRALNFKFVDRCSKPNRNNIYQCCKSLHCLMYQCSEGDVPEKELYKAMKEVIHKLEAHIVNSLPAYVRAAWD